MTGGVIKTVVTVRIIKYKHTSCTLYCALIDCDNVPIKPKQNALIWYSMLQLHRVCKCPKRSRDENQTICISENNVIFDGNRVSIIPPSSFCF